MPLSERQRALIEARVSRECARAGAILETPLAPPPVRFDLRGTAAGMFCARGPRCWLRFNPWLFAQEFDRHLDDTVTHEIAHYGIHTAFPGMRLKPHGPEWRGLMKAMGADPRATFEADLTGVPVRRQQRHPYVCGCQEHWVSTTRHNRIRARRAVYRCRFCDGELKALA